MKHAAQLCIGLGMTMAVSASALGKPNFVFVLLDDVGTGWVAPYAERLTPEDLEPDILDAYRKWQATEVDAQKHIDAARQAMPTLSRLANDGVVFDRAFATASICGPSRAGLLTGTFQQRWRVYDNTDIEDVTGLTPDFPCLAKSLQEAGYACGAVGKWHVGRKDPDVIRKALKQTGKSTEFPENKTLKQIAWPVRDEARKLGYYDSCCADDHPLNNGFDYYFGYNSPSALFYECATLWDNNGLVSKRPKGEFLTELLTEKALGFVEKSVGEQKPFFLYLSYMSNHGPLAPPPEKYSSCFDSGIPFTDQFAGHLRAVDAGLKTLIARLEKCGQLGNTVFVFSSDNGQPAAVPPYNAPFKGGKGTGWVGGLRVPLIISGAGIERLGFSDGLVSLADILPTFLDMADIRLPDNIDGTSLKPFLAGEADAVSREWLASIGLHSTRWSYSYYGGERNKKDSTVCPLYGMIIQDDQVLMHLTEIPGGLYRIYPEGIPSSKKLYDLKADPLQQTDMASQYPEKTQALSGRLHGWLEGLEPPAQNHDGQLLELMEQSQ